ncbi:MAG: cytochrome c3 family protein [Verrucomicrobia bacterium]|nr:cytochrome c3 family protein [Verrucomicrobiota bacterium]
MIATPEVHPDRGRVFHYVSRAAVALALSAGLSLAGPAQAAGIANSDCLACHDDPKLTKKVGGKDVSLAIQPKLFAKSVHGSAACVDCHVGIKELPHAEGKLPPAQCGGCHDDQTKQYAASIHGQQRSNGTAAAANCSDCHGKHDILPVIHVSSPTSKLNLPRTCGRCHNNPRLTKDYAAGRSEVVSHYTESIHGRALLTLGVTMAPSCNDCHGVHDIRRGSDSKSKIHHANVNKTCGKCHGTVEKVFQQSVHGQLLAKADKRGPVCNDCHTAHEIERTSAAHFKAASDERCGRCHQDRLEFYRETYHGKAMALGLANIAACYDCHGHHDVFPATDNRSRLAPANKLATCQQCHPRANSNFIGYLPHANALDRKNYPQLFATLVSMTALLVGVFVVFGIHTGFWFYRSSHSFVSDAEAFMEKRARARADEEWFTRFTPFQRFLHFLVVTSFLLLVITGMPLKFYDARWAQVVFGVLGGADVARALHRFGAIVTFIYFGLHVLSLAHLCWCKRPSYRDPATGRFRLRRVWAFVLGPDSPMFNLQDGRDFVAHVKWFVGKGPRPEFERWTYWEKFDYFAVFWGVAIIGASGLVMWFPEFFTRFLPGWVINVALVIHSDEALLAAGFIFTFHFFNVHFRPEKIPMDPVIFSGRISKTELLHEHKRHYERLVAEGRLDENRLRDEWQRWKRIAHGFGYAFFGIGLVLLVLILYAMAARLLH